MKLQFVLTITDEHTSIPLFYKVSDDQTSLQREAVNWMREEYAFVFLREQKLSFPVAHLSSDYDYVVWLSNNVQDSPGINIHDLDNQSWIIDATTRIRWSIVSDTNNGIWQFRINRPVPGWEGYIPIVTCLSTGERIVGRRCEYSEAEEWCFQQIT